MARLLGAVLIVLFPLPAVAAGFDAPPWIWIYFYLIWSVPVMAVGYGFSGMRALQATVAALILALILLVGVWSTHGLEKALIAVFATGTLALFYAPVLGLGIYLGRRAGKRASARKARLRLLTTHGT
jgi:hypothetical protein